MKRPDENTIRMLTAELDRIIADVIAGEGSVAEQKQVILLVMEITVNTTGLHTRVKRKVHEILYRYYAMIEGMDKK